METIIVDIPVSSFASIPDEIRPEFEYRGTLFRRRKDQLPKVFRLRPSLKWWNEHKHHLDGLEFNIIVTGRDPNEPAPKLAGRSY